jgi:AcrR family transcriptional regulator
MAKRNTRRGTRKTSLESAAAVFKRHFAGLNVANLITANREYPSPARVDLQRTIDELLPGFSRSRQLGIHVEYSHETLTVGHLLANLHSPVVVGPLQYDEIDVGEALTIRCVRRALWLARHGRLPFALVIGQATRYGEACGTNIEVAVPPGEKGAELARNVLDNIESRVRAASSYRGKVLSLEATNRYTGAMGPIRVHKLKQVTLDQLVLPSKTLALLDRNVIGFIAQREKLKSLGLAAKKGLLFYGPPGTGKTYTIHYLATRLPNYTTLLITAEQVGLLDHYFQLARFLQPSMVVIEDVDLIARTRENMNSPCEEALLNKLLNEMDGLREDAEILFVLTTNRPDQLEKALASRPGRIDQAIEFPLPDEEGRRQLARLYAYGLQMGPEVVELIVRRTAGGSAALIKELMRRAAQFLLEDGRAHLQPRHIDAALEEMLLSGGSLNASLLGAPGVPQLS